MPIIQASKLFTLNGDPILNGIVVTDKDGRIEDILRSSDGINENNILKVDGSICPGFVNAHCHLELSHLKDQIQKYTGLTNFAREIIIKRNNFSIEEKEEAMRIADDAMHKRGIVAIGDISNDDSSIKVKSKSNIYYHTFIELIGLNPESAESRYLSGKELQNKFLDKSLSASTSPHAPYSVSTILMKKIADEQGGSITIHNQECEAENDFFISKSGAFLDLYQSLNLELNFYEASGKTSLQTYLPHLTSNKKLALVHNTFSNDEDITYAEQINRQLYWCLCLKANEFIENKTPPIDLLIKNNCRIIIGTDSLASNDELDIMSEIRIIKKTFPTVSLNECLKWTCMNGAAFLQINDVYGTLEKGKRPGLILINEETQEVIKRIV